MKKSFEGKGEWGQLIFPIISAVLFAFCFPPYNVWQVAFIAFIPLLITTLTAKKSLLARGGGFIFGFLFYGFSLRWLWNIFPGFSILLRIALALFPGLFAWGLFLLKRRFNRAIALSFAPFIWLGLEYFRSECWHLKFAWLTPGFSQATNLPFLQFASVLGVYGISALVLAVNCSICYLIIGKTPLKKRWIPTGLSLLFIGLIYFWGASQIQQPSAGNIQVGAIQTEASSLKENRKLS
jgi:apolipoprotein N-acyltransferase